MIMKFSYCFVFVCVLCLAACSEASKSTVEIKNETDVFISRVEVELGGETISFDGLDAGASKSGSYEPKLDSNMIISYELMGVKVNCVEDIYVTPGIKSKFLVLLYQDGCRVAQG